VLWVYAVLRIEISPKSACFNHPLDITLAIEANQSKYDEIEQYEGDVLDTYVMASQYLPIAEREVQKSIAI
jgi:hypothetical protein